MKTYIVFLLLIIMGCSQKQRNFASTSLFLNSELWYKRIDALSPDVNSSTIIPTVTFGNNIFQIGYTSSFHVLKADSRTRRVAFVDGMPTNSDCDKEATVPLPVGGALEGELDYTCSTGGDCHLIVHDVDARKLYELWNANYANNVLTGQCLVVWNLARNYWTSTDSNGRGDQCTSSDAAGFPITALITGPDEISAAIASNKGDVGHALRFILPTSMMKQGVFVHPATHGGSPSNADPNAIPFGSLLRLKSSFDVNTLGNEAAKVVARTLQRYGMYLADGGTIALTLQDDAFTTHKWSEWNFGPQDLSVLTPHDFELMPKGSDIPLTYDCVRAK